MNNSMRNIEKCILAKTLATLRLEKARQEFGNEYVYGFDDVERLLIYQIDTLSVVAKEQTNIEKNVKRGYLHCWEKETNEDHSDCERCCQC